MSKYEWGDIFRRIDSSGQQDPVAKTDVEQWLSIVVCAKRNTIVRDYEIQEIYKHKLIQRQIQKNDKRYSIDKRDERCKRDNKKKNIVYI